MSSSPHVEVFRGLDTSELPDVHTLATDRLQVLWILVAAKWGGAAISLTAGEISDVLQNVCGIAVSRQRVSAILSTERQSTSRAGRKAPARFQVMKKGEDELLGSGLSPLFIDPTQALSSIRKLEDVLSQLSGEVRVCDTYINNHTIDYLALCTKSTSIKLLTENIQESNKLKRDLAAFTKEHSTPLEIRQASPGQLHDRYFIHQHGLLLVGASLKDISKKQSMVVSLSQNFAREMARAFDGIWSRANRFP
ncbi:hypothetical protein [Microvirga alba]|uniref:Uncharacterized protein n=1 Tax=Microvirga alba TaxID=2791025 RepID=A0A931BL96_9HYPH|nr:hypothetical protein [Microvirga alba]MBF9233326.1 hypothetical protein [Microvirga alba]